MRLDLPTSRNMAALSERASDPQAGRRLLSILVPVYNEEEFLPEILDRVIAAPLPDAVDREIILVNDGSTDGSAQICQQYASRYPQLIRLISHERNQGKGAAIRTAIQQARGEFSLIQDSDLEYDPREYGRLLKPLLEGLADVVYGSRFLVAGERRVLYFWHSVANRLLTGLCNLVSDLNLTDMETCYKAFRTKLAQSIPIRSRRFGIEPELTVKLARRQARFYETPISYHGRTYEEGKKIGLKDAIEAVFVIFRSALTTDLYTTSGPDTLHALTAAPRFNLWMADTIRPYLGESVLEIGAGIGNLTRALAPRRKRYVATDIDEEHLARLRTRLHHRPNLTACRCDVTRAEELKEFEGQMDTVVCVNVLEHVEDDLGGLVNIRSAIKPGGRVVVLVPQGQSAFGTLDEALGHHRRYSHAELREKMEKAGFRMETVLDFNRISWPGWYVSGRWLGSRALSPFGLGLFDRLVWLWRRIDRYVPWPPTSIIGVGSRPE